MGWQEWPLFIFTVVAQAATGAFWWCCLALFTGLLVLDQTARLENLMLVIWLMIVVAFCAAAFHLGRPLRAINASFRFGRAHFSNEVSFGSFFVGLGGLRWLMIAFAIGSPTLQSVVLGLTVLASFAFLYSMTAFYLMPAVPTWNTPLTPAAYFVTTMLCGSAVAATIFAAAEIAPFGILTWGPMFVAALSVLAAITVTLLQSAGLPKISSAIKRAVDLSPNYASLMALRFAILSAALGIWVLDVSLYGALSVTTGIVCSLLVMFGEIVGRGVHYGLHMTVGLR